MPCEQDAHELVLYFSEARGFTRAAPTIKSFIDLPARTEAPADGQDAVALREPGALGVMEPAAGHRSAPMNPALAAASGMAARTAHDIGAAGLMGEEEGEENQDERKSEKPYFDKSFSNRFRDGGGATSSGKSFNVSASTGFDVPLSRETSTKSSSVDSSLPGAASLPSRPSVLLRKWPPHEHTTATVTTTVTTVTPSPTVDSAVQLYRSNPVPQPEPMAGAGRGGADRTYFSASQYRPRSAATKDAMAGGRNKPPALPPRERPTADTSAGVVGGGRGGVFTGGRGGRTPEGGKRAPPPTYEHLHLFQSTKGAADEENEEDRRGTGSSNRSPLSRGAPHRRGRAGYDARGPPSLPPREQVVPPVVVAGAGPNKYGLDRNSGGGGRDKLRHPPPQRRGTWTDDVQTDRHLKNMSRNTPQELTGPARGLRGPPQRRSTLGDPAATAVQPIPLPPRETAVLANVAPTTPREDVSVRHTARREERPRAATSAPPHYSTGAAGGGGASPVGGLNVRNSLSSTTPAAVPFANAEDVAASAFEAELANDIISPGGDGRLSAGERHRFGGIERTEPSVPRSPTASLSRSPAARRQGRRVGRETRGGLRLDDDENWTTVKVKNAASVAVPGVDGTGGVPLSCYSRGANQAVSSSPTKEGGRRHSGIGTLIRGGGDKLKQFASGGGVRKAGGAAAQGGAGGEFHASPVSDTDGKRHRVGSRFFSNPRANAGGVNNFTVKFRSVPGLPSRDKSPVR